jgi:hypothetical protein
VCSLAGGSVQFDQYKRRHHDDCDHLCSKGICRMGTIALVGGAAILATVYTVITIIECSSIVVDLR